MPNYGKWAADRTTEGVFFTDLNDTIAQQHEAGYDEARLKTGFFPGDHTHPN